MKEIGKIRINPNSDFWKSIKAENEKTADQVAAEAAEKARKEYLARQARIEAANKAYLDSIRHYDQIEFEHDDIRQQIAASLKRRRDLEAKVSKEWKKEEELRKKLQATCSHKECIEHKTYWSNEWDDRLEGPMERKCITCFLVDREKDRRFHTLANSVVVNMRRTVKNKEYELDFDDLTWEILVK